MLAVKGSCGLCCVTAMCHCYTAVMWWLVGNRFIFLADSGERRSVNTTDGFCLVSKTTGTSKKLFKLYNTLSMGLLLFFACFEA